MQRSGHHNAARAPWAAMTPLQRPYQAAMTPVANGGGQGGSRWGNGGQGPSIVAIMAGGAEPGPPGSRTRCATAHVGARVGRDALASQPSRWGLARPGRALGAPPACALAWLPFSRTPVMGLPAPGGPGLGLSGAAQTNRCCWSSHEKQTAIKPRASRDREFLSNEQQWRIEFDRRRFPGASQPSSWVKPPGSAYDSWFFGGIFIEKAGDRSSFNAMTVWEQYPRSHHKGATDANATGRGKGDHPGQIYLFANQDKTS